MNYEERAEREESFRLKKIIVENVLSLYIIYFFRSGSGFSKSE